MTAPRFNHAYLIAFSLETEDATGENVPPHIIRQAILKRLAEIDDDELKEAVGPPTDSYKLENDQ